MSVFRQMPADEKASRATCPSHSCRSTCNVMTPPCVIVVMGLCIGLCLPQAFAADDRPAPRSNGWTAVSRPKTRSPQIRLIAVDTPQDAATIPDEASASTGPVAPSLKSANSDSAAASAGAAEQHPSVTERLKQALQAERESRKAAPRPAAPAPAHSDSIPSQESISVTPALQPDPESQDPLRREKAESFLRLKMLLLQFRSQVQTSPGTSVEKPVTGPVHDSENGNAEDDETHGAKATNDPHESHESPDSPDSPDSHQSHNSPDSHEIDVNNGTNGTHERHGPPDSHIAIDAHVTPTIVHSAISDATVVEGPIDRLGLANNLYAVGDYLLALEMYEQADTVNMTAQQQIWTEYQIANCLRRIGKIAEASNRYRRLADQPEAGWLSEQSQWWVDVLEQMRIVRKGLETKNP